MKIGDVVVATDESIAQAICENPMIYMGKGLWTGWVRVYCPKEQRVVQVRRLAIEKVTT
mgnify:FL=1|jgi:hypothetical protein